jgi:hypothetical protein
MPRSKNKFTRVHAHRRRHENTHIQQLRSFQGACTAFSQTFQGCKMVYVRVLIMRCAFASYGWKVVCRRGCMHLHSFFIFTLCVCMCVLWNLLYSFCVTKRTGRTWPAYVLLYIHTKLTTGQMHEYLHTHSHTHVKLSLQTRMNTTMCLTNIHTTTHTYMYTQSTHSPRGNYCCSIVQWHNHGDTVVQWHNHGDIRHMRIDWQTACLQCCLHTTYRVFR